MNHYRMTRYWHAAILFSLLLTPGTIFCRITAVSPSRLITYTMEADPDYFTYSVHRGPEKSKYFLGITEIDPDIKPAIFYRPGYTEIFVLSGVEDQPTHPFTLNANAYAMYLRFIVTPDWKHKAYSCHLIIKRDPRSAMFRKSEENAGMNPKLIGRYVAREFGKPASKLLSGAKCRRTTTSVIDGKTY